MPPQLASLICILFILYLFWVDCKKSDGPSKAVWIPFLWMFFAGSRYASAWLNLSTSNLSTLEMASIRNEGSPVDAATFLILIVAGVFNLYRKKINWTILLNQNKWLLLYFLYCGISITWSNSPFIAFKRVFKELGNPIMVLVILTEERPYETVGAILRHLAFVLLPLSLLFIKYYPELGRAYSYSGQQMYTGVGNQKNALGQICLIAAIYYSWQYFLNRNGDFIFELKSNIMDILLIGMIAYLLYMAQSATSLVCSVLAVFLFFVSRIKLIANKPGRILVFMVVVSSVFFVMDATMDVKDAMIEALGRDKSLTSRVPIWQTLGALFEEFSISPFVGAGYQSFWAGDNLIKIWTRLDAGIIQAHNGYFEQYLNLGYMGVGFIGLIVLSALLKIRRHLEVDYASAMLRLCFIVIALIYNFTEASFYGINNIWVLLLIGVIEIPNKGSFY